MQTVELATGVHIDHYVEIGFGGFVKMVDALGGVTVCTTTPLKDPKSGLDIPAGTTSSTAPRRCRTYALATSTRRRTWAG